MSRQSIGMRMIFRAAVLLFPLTLFAFPNTMWTRPADIRQWTNPLDSVWNKLPAYNGTVKNTWPKVPLTNGMKVLCIGNSLSGWGAPIDENLTAVYKYLNPGKNISVKLMGRGVAWLRDYVAETELDILDSIRSGRYDFLVVQPWMDAMWPRSDGLDEQRNRNVDSLKSHFVRAADSLYRECVKVGTQMVIWSPNGSQFDDRTVFMTYSAFNTKHVANRLKIPYAFTVETFDSVYFEVDDPAVVWYDAVHESAAMSAVNALLLYSAMTGGGSIDAMPQNWLDVPGTKWATAYGTRTTFKSQDALTKWTKYFVGVQKTFNNANVPTGIAPRSVLAGERTRQMSSVSSRCWDIAGRQIAPSSSAVRSKGIVIGAKQGRMGAFIVK